jgi:hypothetical protein
MILNWYLNRLALVNVQSDCGWLLDKQSKQIQLASHCAAFEIAEYQLSEHKEDAV